jgi:N-acetylglucosaminyl-diphospho-decaprenol L-rhamnosyltransferase
MHEPEPDVSIIIVGLNAREYVRQCLESIAAAEWRAVRHEVVYVDNGSTDGSPAMMRQHFPSAVLIANDSNVGFCKAANQGARLARGRYFYFLNDDTLVVDDAIAILVEYMESDSAAGTVGSRLLFPDGSEQFSGRRFPKLMNGILGRRSVLTRLFPDAPWVRHYLCKEEIHGERPFAVDWVSAAGQIVRREMFAQLGGFAEDYYYWHEAVFCDRIHRAGQTVLLHPQSKIIHYEGKGTGTRTFRAQRFHIVDFHRGAFRCYCEHYGLGSLNPMRWVAAAALATRAAGLLAVTSLRHGWLRATAGLTRA